MVIFFRDFVEPPDQLNSSFGTFGYLPHMYAQSTGNQLPEAVKAAALANLAHQSSVKELAIKARKHYGRALVELSKAMNDRQTAVADETLASTNALGLYEVFHNKPLPVESMY